MPNECNTRAHQSEKRVHGGMSTPTRKLSVPSLLVVVTMCPQPGVGLVLQETQSSCVHWLQYAVTAYPAVQRRTTQEPRMQETSATLGIAVQSMPCSDAESKGVIYPPPTHNVSLVNTFEHLPQSAKTNTHVLDVDAIPWLAHLAPLLE